MKKTIAVLLTLLLALSLCACGGTQEDASMLGTYQLYAMDYDENNIILTDEFFSGENYITLKSGGSAVMCLENDTANVRWKADGDKLTLTAADGDMPATLSDGILTLQMDGSNLYFVGETGSKASIKAITLDALLTGAATEAISDAEPAASPDTAPAAAESAAPAATAETQAAPEATPAPTGPSELQQLWNGWYYGCIDMDGCTENWEFLNGQTYDAVMYVELDRDGNGRFAIFDPFGILVGNEHSSIYIDAVCHADTRYLYGDSGTAFNDALNPSEWQFVHNLSIPEKLHVGSQSVEANGAVIGYDFQFKPWGDRWEGDNYTKFIPYFDAYISAVDAGLTSPFDDSFTGFGIAEPLPAAPEAPVSTADTPTAHAGTGSALLGANPTKLDVNDRGVLTILYPADQFTYDDWYGKLKNESTGVGILIDPMLGATNLQELKASYEENNSDEQDYSLVETTVNGYRALILQYSDWLGSTMRVDIDFGGSHDGWYGVSFAVSGDSLADCNTELVWAIIESMELQK